MQSLRGQLLVASPALIDPNFHRTVVLIGEHGEEGAMGLVLNRPSETTVAEAVPSLDGLADAGASIYVGGPVEPSVVMVLARFSDPAGDEMVTHGIGFLPAGTDLDELGERAADARVFAGYAGWGPGQLEEEIERSDWIVEEPAEEEIFSPDPERLWSEVLGRMGGRFALLARMPADPSLN